MQSSDEANIGIRVYEDLQVHHRSQIGIDQHEDSFDYDDGLRFYMDSFGFSRMSCVLIDRLLDVFAGGKRFEVVDQQFGIERIGVVKVDLVPQVHRHVTEISVVRILLKPGYLVGANGLDDLL
jgi:hypothetical protein